MAARHNTKEGLGIDAHYSLVEDSLHENVFVFRNGPCLKIQINGGDKMLKCFWWLVLK